MMRILSCMAHPAILGPLRDAPERGPAAMTEQHPTTHGGPHALAMHPRDVSLLLQTG
jgi:hypothetical protein